ncbi:putative RNA-directed DNA polymerase [Tanacetum coccineum]
MAEGDKPPKDKGKSYGSGENNIDQYDPLFLHSNDTNGVSIIGFELEGTENYKVWKAAITITIHTKNKLGFINSKIPRPVEEDVFMGQVFSKNVKVGCDELEETYNKLKEHNQLLKLMQFLMGLDEIYVPIRSLILTIDPIPDVKGPLLPCQEMSPTEDHHLILPLRLETLLLCFELVGHPPNFKKNNNSGFNKGASSSNSVSRSSSSMPVNIAVSKINITVGHLNGTKAMATHMGSLMLTDQIVIHDVLVAPGYEDSIQRTQVGTGSESNRFCKEKGILHQTSCPYTPQQNGIAERKHRHLLNVGRALMFQGGIPLNMWTECILTVVYLINRLPSFVLSGKSPYELVFNIEPNLSHLKTFGCLCFSTVLIDSKKFSSRFEKPVFIGYSNDKKGYKLFSLESKKVFFSRDVKFYETVFPFKNNTECKEYQMVFENKNSLNFFNCDENKSRSSEPYDDRRDKEPEISEGTDHMSYEGTENTGNTRRDKGKHPNDSEPAEAVSDIEESATLVENDKEFEGDDNFYQEFNEMFEIPNVVPDSQSEVNLMRSSRKTRMLKKFSDFKVDSKVKYSIDKHVNYSNLSVEKFNFSTSLNKIIEPKTFDEASKDIRWVEAMNLELEAFNRNGTWIMIELPAGRKPIVVKIVTVRCILSLAVFNGWSVYQLDVNNAFLYGDLEEDVYMSLPEGYFSKDDKRVCKLVKSLYGLKRAPRKRNEKLTSVLLESDFKQSNNSDEIDKFKIFLSSKFMINDLGKLKYFLGIEVLESNEGLVLTRRKYYLELLTEFGMLGCKPCGTPIESKEGVVKLSKGIVGDTDYPLTRINNYQKLVGKLIYLTHTRPDISYAVHVLSPFMHAPLQSHLKLTFRFLRYLKTAPGKGIPFNKGSDLNLRVHVDSDWAKCKVTRKSVTRV